MFNEILTGKSTLERAPEQASPYRTESVPQISLTCVDCAAHYQAPVGTPVGRCGPCHLAMASRNQAASNAALQASFAAINARRRGHRWMRWAMLALLGVALSLIKRQMRKDFAESQPRAQPVYIQEDPYVTKLWSFKYEMCACADAACRSTVRAKWMNWQNTAIPPTDEHMLDLARESTDAMFACMNLP